MGVQANAKPLIKALPLIASALGKRYGVEVKFGDYRTAATDGKVIYLPHLPVEGDSQALEVLANGFIDHEASHIRTTDFSVVARAARSRPIRKHLLNIVEDLRIEQDMMRAYPGTRKNLALLTEHLVEEGLFTLPEQPHPASVLVSTALLCGRADVLGQKALYDLADQAEAQLRSVVGDGAAIRLRRLLEQARDLASTEQALDLTDKILKMLKDEQKKQDQKQSQPPQPSQSDSDDDDSQGDTADQSQSPDDSDGDPDDSSGDSDPADSDGDPDDSEDAGDTASPDDSDGDPDDSGGDSDSADSDGDPDDSEDAGDKGASGDPHDSGDDEDAADDSGDTEQAPGDDAGDDGSDGQGHGDGMDVAEALKKALEAKKDEIESPSDMGEFIADRLQGELGDTSNVPISVAASQTILDGVGHGSVQEDEVRHVAMKMRSRLQAKLETMLRERRYSARQGQKLEGRHLSRVRTADTRVFRRHDEKQGLDTAIHVLLDRSGSMNGPSIDVAAPATLALMQALDGIKGLACSSATFPGVTPLTRFDETVAATKERYSRMCLGTTPLAQALLWSMTQEMNERRENRKIVMVVTDGDPDDFDQAKALVDQMERNNIEMIGVGILHSGVQHLFRNHVVINALDELPQKLFQLIEAKLIR